MPMPAAVMLISLQTCPMSTLVVPHVGGPIIMGAPNVIVGVMPAACVGDMGLCIGPPNVIAKGSATVIINNRPAARMTDKMAHGGSVVLGFPTVIIGE